METEKNKKGLVIMVVILIICFLGAVGYICYDKIFLEKNLKEEITVLNNQNKENSTNYNEQIKNLEDKLKESEEKLKNNTENESNYILVRDEYRFYAIGECEAIYSYKGKIYNVLNDDFCSGGLYHNPDDKFKNGFLEQELTRDEDTSSAYFAEDKYDVKEKDLYKVVITHDPVNSSAATVVYFIMKDGTVKKYGMEYNYYANHSKEISKYKVRDIKEECNTASYQEKGYCAKSDITLTLFDGTKKTITLSNKQK